MDKLDEAIEYNRGLGNRYYAETLGIIRDRLQALEAKQAHVGPAWLIEVGSPTQYYCGEGDWCSNPNHAHKFASKKDAEAKAASMTTMEPVRCCEHLWIAPSADGNNGDGKHG